MIFTMFGDSCSTSFSAFPLMLQCSFSFYTILLDLPWLLISTSIVSIPIRACVGITSLGDNVSKQSIPRQM